MTLIERLRYRLSMLVMAVEMIVPILVRSWRVAPIAGGAPDEEEAAGAQPIGTLGAEAQNEGEPGENEELDLDRAKSKISKANQEAAALRKRAKDAEAKIKEFEDRDKTESQKLAEQADADRKLAAGATQEAARLRVALRKGLTETQAKRLVGETEEELAADADQLLEDFKGQEPDQKPIPVSTRPVESLRPGAVPDARASDNDLTGTARLAAAYKAKE